MQEQDDGCDHGVGKPESLRLLQGDVLVFDNIDTFDCTDYWASHDLASVRTTYECEVISIGEQVHPFAAQAGAGQGVDLNLAAGGLVEPCR